jgi:DNA-binding Lrp family transcriptional regulator
VDVTGLPKLDRIDLKILAELQADGRVSNVELARRVGLSASPCLQRVKRLEAAGYILSYRAQIDLAKLGEIVTVFTEVTLADHTREDFERFERAIAGEPAVVECHLISGGYDYLVKFVTRGIAHYQRVIEGLLDADIGITKFFSYIVIKTPIENRPPAAGLFGTGVED